EASTDGTGSFITTTTHATDEYGISLAGIGGQTITSLKMRANGKIANIFTGPAISLGARVIPKSGTEWAQLASAQTLSNTFKWYEATFVGPWDIGATDRLSVVVYANGNTLAPAQVSTVEAVVTQR